MKKIVQINQKLSNDSQDYWVGTVSTKTTVPFYATPDAIFIGGLKFSWPEGISSVEDAVLYRIPQEWLNGILKTQIKLQFTITNGYDILLDPVDIETFKQRLMADELTILDTRNAKQTSYEHWCNEY